MSEETLSNKANRLAREAVKAEIARHSPVMEFGNDGPRHFCVACWNDCGQLMWPCPTVEALSAADEAISEAEEEEERIANGPFYCGVMTYSQTLMSPAEYCGGEVPNKGDLCAKHDAAGRADAERDDDDYERYKEMRRDG